MGKSLTLNEQVFEWASPVLMGVLNLTPDSFSDGGHYMDASCAVDRAHAMIEEGASIVDLGAESTRPGSESVSAAVQIKRLLPVIERLPKDKCILSVDTNNREVQSAVAEAGVHMINDILGGSEALFALAKQYQLALLLMHTSAAPKDMQQHTSYVNLVGQISEYLKAQTQAAMDAGVKHVWVDPGIGFGKTFEQNMLLLNRLDDFSGIGMGLAIGTSRKSWIGDLCGADVSDRLPASLASIVMAYLKGCELFRVHDVKASKQALDAAKAIQEAGEA